MSIRDSGKRIQLGGMVRDTSEDKVKYDLVFDGPMFERWAKHLTEGAKKYSVRNWMGADNQEALARFRESAVRHFIQWLRGDSDEDHAAAVFFNINGAEYVKDRLNALPDPAGVTREQARPERRIGPADRRECQNDDLADANNWRRRVNGSTPGKRCAECGRRKTDTTRYSKLPRCS